eukprot:TRINITY_DN12045_c0_g1_i1.p1 TRINITY_DN12045_c0_g1~~TRINITY_DN12045_c0_g1_i1.p1  ORF type:complete len:390 (-),score=103.77 TRINITY_DN12045_c0_g1_i1:123-1292(-)
MITGFFAPTGVSVLNMSLVSRATRVNKKSCNHRSIRRYTSETGPSQMSEKQRVKHDQLEDYLGLKQKDAGTAYRDMRIESQVTGLFKQVLQMGESGTLHPDDIALKSAAIEAQKRLDQRLAEVQTTHPHKYEGLLSAVMQHETDEKKQNDLRELSEGFVPGSLSSPWTTGNNVWRAFLESMIKEHHLELDEPEGMYKDGGFKSKPLLEQDEASLTGVYKEYPFLRRDPNEKVEELEDPFAGDAAVAAKVKKCQEGACIFCSKNKKMYPLEPMNVPLLTRFMTSAGYIKPRRQTGLCKKMQSRVSKTIKHSRMMGLFSYTKGTFTIHNPLNTGFVPRYNNDFSPSKAIENMNTNLDAITSQGLNLGQLRGDEDPTLAFEEEEEELKENEQ